jgi:hypothetical protein
MAVMALVNPKRALMVCCFGLLLGSTALIILTWATDGGFLRHIILYNINRYSLKLAVQYGITTVLPQLSFVVLAIISVVISWKRFASERTWHDLASFRHELASGEALQLMAILTLYLGVSTCMLVTIGKSGAGMSYFVEWMGILSVFIGTLVAAVTRNQLIKAERDTARFAIVFGFLLPVLLLIQVLRSPASWDFGFADLTQSQQLNQLVVRIRDASQPVLSDDMVLLMRAGKEVPWEPAIFTELASTDGGTSSRSLVLLHLIILPLLLHMGTTTISAPGSQAPFRPPIRAQRSTPSTRCTFHWNWRNRSESSP